MTSFTSATDTLDKKKHTRRLSAHISSRWYRSPEVIMSQKNYNSQMDVWGLGCVFAELLILV